ncbi:MAG: ChbG/HpnK family deacetylase, partial [Bryobacteraceae bacterium]
SVLDPRRNLPYTVGELLRSVVVGRLRIYDELAAQAGRIVEAGVRPTHLDTHKHTHLLPPVLEAVARISRDFAVPWVRRPFDFPLQPGRVPWTKRVVSGAFGAARGRFHRVLTGYGCRTTDHFAGFQITGRFGPAELAQLIHALPEGTTEFMCHPGYCGTELQAASTRLKQSREAELRALTSPEAQAAIRDAAVDLVNYRDLGR